MRMRPRVVTAIDARATHSARRSCSTGTGRRTTASSPWAFCARSSCAGSVAPGRFRDDVGRDFDALMPVRKTGRPPAALELLDRLGAEQSHEVFTVEQSHEG